MIPEMFGKIFCVHSLKLKAIWVMQQDSNLKHSSFGVTLFQSLDLNPDALARALTGCSYLKSLQCS